MPSKTDRHTCVAFVPYKRSERRFSLPALGSDEEDARSKFINSERMTWAKLRSRGWEIVPVRISEIKPPVEAEEDGEDEEHDCGEDTCVCR